MANLFETFNQMSIDEFVNLIADRVSDTVIKKQNQNKKNSASIDIDKKFYTIKDVIEILQISRSTLWRYIDQGVFPKPNFNNNRWSYKQLEGLFNEKFKTGGRHQ